EQVWAIVRQIPYGRVATYGQIAKLILPPEGISQEDYAASSSRWVGLAMAASPEDVPWQRVINSQGKISHRPEAGKQKQLLEAEGLLFYHGKLDLNEHQWNGPGVSDEPKQGRLF
ncbi:MAG: MGMT family protein, partial [Leucothrix sp.]